MINKKNKNKLGISLMLNPKLWKDFKRYCLDNDISMTKKLEEMINGVLKK